MSQVNEKANTLGSNEVDIDKVQIGNDRFFKISNHDKMRPFFMSLISPFNHWMFISSNGGLTAGRKNAEYALFPYYTDDKITESIEVTGPKTLLWVNKNNEKYYWEPFSERYWSQYKLSRNIYKSAYGNKIRFEEINHDLALTFTYQWNASDRFGFVKQASIKNNGSGEVQISMLDGFQNILPASVGSDLQNQSSNLVDAYKRNELIKDSGMGVFALSAIIVDRAEPSEALKANIAWSIGLDDSSYLLSSLQVDQFRKGMPVNGEDDIKAEKGAYFNAANFNIDSNGEQQWMQVLDVNKNHSEVFSISEMIKKEDQIIKVVQEDIEKATIQLRILNESADGLQLTADEFRDARHYSNVMFNIMRGGIFDFNYQIEKNDFQTYLLKANKIVHQLAVPILEKVKDVFDLQELKSISNQLEDPDFKRLCFEYLPLKFSRRHGDPSRPWNKFSINTKKESDGSKILDYEGNWRDIFQNWEALAFSYPSFIEGMIHKFLNASTFDGYNPYRVTKDGFDWEAIEPDDPWSYIGYWGDHQIIYLLKLLEFSQKADPSKLNQYFNQDIFVYANVPYKIKSFDEILANPKDTINFDEHLHLNIEEKRNQLGADGALLQQKNQKTYHVNFIEKILATMLAKWSNFIPEGGIWMNTQRPEWNDANNALVGNGVSMVTLYYLRRFHQFFNTILADETIEKVNISNELLTFFNTIKLSLDQHKGMLKGKFSNEQRQEILTALGNAGSDYRLSIYKNSFSGEKIELPINDLKAFLEIGLEYLDHSIHSNKRRDNLYHAYNLMSITNERGVSIAYLSEMLEGQVAVLSAGVLNAEETLSVLDALKASKLFRADQYSYILYPNKELPLFQNRNNIPQASISQSELLVKMLDNQDTRIVEKDVLANYHFNGNFKNADDLKAGLEKLQIPVYADLVEKEKDLILEIFEKEFNHKAFTGRSGTFFGYEGLGSIYWHMVSKLLFAVQECCLKAEAENVDPSIKGRLLEHYYEINEGIGVHKSPSLYGAFPTDPYSHTPAGKGAQQPGMTGQVKEDIISRFGELGIFINNGELQFNPCLLRKSEFLKNSKTFKYFNAAHQEKELIINKDELCFTFCQVPIIYQVADENGVLVIDVNKKETNFSAWDINREISEKIFNRNGEIDYIIVKIKKEALK